MGTIELQEYFQTGSYKTYTVEMNGRYCIAANYSAAFVFLTPDEVVFKNDADDIFSIRWIKEIRKDPEAITIITDRNGEEETVTVTCR